MNNRAQRTDDGRYVVVDGRRWRASDPSIPDGLRQELVDELMAARRAVRTDPGTARPRVQDAKVALGERGEPWWEPPSEPGRRARIAATVRALLARRGPDGTTCPNDIARVVGGGSYRTELAAVREVVATLADDGIVEVRRRGVRTDPRAVRGPVRVARGPRWEPDGRPILGEQ